MKYIFKDLNFTIWKHHISIKLHSSGGSVPESIGIGTGSIDTCTFRYYYHPLSNFTNIRFRYYCNLIWEPTATTRALLLGT